MASPSPEQRYALMDRLSTYAMALDERDRALYAGCLVKDVEIVGFGAGHYSGIDTWLDYVWSALDKFSATQHLLGQQLATVDGDRANTRTEVQAWHQFTDDRRQFTLWGTYLSELQLIDKQWLISRHELVLRGTAEHPPSAP